MSAPTVRHARFSLRRGPWQLTLAPGVGGAVHALSWNGVDVLRAAPSDTSAVLEMAAFPLIPFVGRITDGRFSFSGRSVQLPPNFPPEPHAIHGQAWQHPWQVEAHDETSALLGFEHPRGDWPWHYRARQRFVLEDDGVSLTLTLENLDDAAMPGGLGWHPYFPRAGARLRADLWERFSIATGRSRHDRALPQWRELAELVLDDVFELDRAAADLDWPDRRVRLTASNAARFLVVYVPPGQDFFCVEPVSHVPDAVNAEDPTARGLQVLARGARLTLEVRLTVATR